MVRKHKTIAEQRIEAAMAEGMVYIAHATLKPLTYQGPIVDLVTEEELELLNRAVDLLDSIGKRAEKVSAEQ